MSKQLADGWCNDPRHVRPSRRDFMYVGLVGGLGLTLGDFFKQSAARAADAVKDEHGGPSKEGVAKSVIHIFLPGGLAQHESFDPKPNAPIEYRGPFGTVKTRIDGEYFGENMKKSAEVADKLTVSSDGHAKRVQLLMRSCRDVQKVSNGRVIRETPEGLLLDWPDSLKPILLTLNER